MKAQRQQTIQLSEGESSPKAVAPEETRTRALLVVLSGGGTGMMYAIRHELLLGRDAEATIVLGDPTVSMRHVRMRSTTTRCRHPRWMHWQ